MSGKKLNIILTISVIFDVLCISLNAQSISGRLVDKNGAALPALKVEVYLGHNSFNTFANADGYFTINNIVSAEKEELPKDYIVSQNYPNPFNPKTRIVFSMPKVSSVKINIFNILGQSVSGAIEKQLNAGTDYVDLELNGQPNGVYVASINIDDKYFVTRKMMLVYGTSHLNSSSVHITAGNIMPPIVQAKFAASTETVIDSIIITGGSLNKNVITKPGRFAGSNLDLGNVYVNNTLTGTPCYGTPAVLYQGKVYNTTSIGDQCWFKENLNVGNFISVLTQPSDNGIIEKYCYNNDPNTCNAYGGYYAWNEAMAYSTAEGTKGICPDGWHIPSKDDFNALTLSVSGNNRALKAVGQGTMSGVGTNTSGFTAMLYGFFVPYQFYSVGSMAGYWTSSETSYDAAYNLEMMVYFSEVYQYVHMKNYAYNIRCIKDEGVNGAAPARPLLESPANGTANKSIVLTLSWKARTGAEYYNIEVAADNNFNNIIFKKEGIKGTSIQVEGLNYLQTYFWRVSASNQGGTSLYSAVWNFTTHPASSCSGVPTVSYAGKTYTTVQIGGQCWLKENLDAGSKIASSASPSNNGAIEKFCYNNEETNCALYGALYNWEEAMAYNLTPRAQGICPAGWHIPSTEEAATLLYNTGYSSNALKGAAQGTGDGLGNNSSGFSALLAGFKSYSSAFGGLASASYFWTSTPNSTDTYALYLDAMNNNTVIGSYGRSAGLSIRCVKDN